MAEESKDDNYVTVKGVGTMTTEEAATVLMNYANRENLEFEFELVDVKKHVLAFRRNQYRLPLIRVTNTVNNETYHLKPEKIIGGGTYGIIVKYNCPTKDLVWTIKIEQLDNASETGIITNLNDKKIHCGQITAYHLGNTEILIISKTKEITTVRADFNRLETMQGDLSQDDADGLKVISLAKATNGRLKLGKSEELKEVEAVLCIVEEVRRQIVCLLKLTKYKDVYTDLKAANVLFVQTVAKQLEVKVGDLGSMASFGNGEKYIATYPCPPSDPYQLDDLTKEEFKEGTVNLTTKEQKEQCLAWQLGILMAQLLGINVEYLEWSNLFNRNSNMPELAITVGGIQVQIIEKIQAALPENLQGIIIPADYAAYLNLNPSKRPSVMKPLPKLTYGECNKYLRMSKT